MKPALEVGTGPHKNIRRNADAAEGLIGESTATTFSRCIVRNHNEEVEIAVGAGVSASAGTEQVDALGVIGALQSFDDVVET
jgi:hypothetical protein